MHGKFDSRHALIALVDEVHRLGGRLKSLFADARRSVDLGDSELMVLNAVVEADRPPTVSQIGRSLGQARQIVQRAANALESEQLIEMMTNPDHKRAPLLVATAAGTAMKRQADACADAIAADLAEGFEAPVLAQITTDLHRLRKQLETRMRGGDN